MTSATYPDHEHPQYITHGDLEAFEGRIINRLSDMEVRLVRDINSAFWRQLLAIGGIYLAILALLTTVMFFALANLWAQIGALQAAVQKITP